MKIKILPKSHKKKKNNDYEKCTTKKSKAASQKKKKKIGLGSVRHRFNFFFINCQSILNEVNFQYLG